MELFDNELGYRIIFNTDKQGLLLFIRFRGDSVFYPACLRE